MRTGRLDRKVTAQRPTTAWENGERPEAWADTATFWASVDEATGRERIRAGQVDAAQPVVVTARYADAQSVTTRDRIRLGGTEDEPEGVLDVVSVREVGRREGLEFLCTLDRDGGA